MIDWADIFVAVVALLVVKNITIGCEFDFRNWAIYGKKYTDWYARRESFQDYLNKEPK